MSTNLQNTIVLFLLQARLNQDQEHFLVNPFGMLYHEITASSLVKIDMQGSVVEQGTTNFGINVAGFMLHSSIHAARPDIKCIIHVHTPSVLAVSVIFGVKLCFDADATSNKWFVVKHIDSAVSSRFKLYFWGPGCLCTF
jgi:ribulose-5-phosphate 4-epimerase/fuculose-1-phosphate aldolase